MEITNFRSIKTRLTFWMVVVAMLPLIAMSIVVYNQSVAAIKEEVFRKLTAIRDLKVDQLDAWIDERVGDARTIAIDLNIRKIEGVINKDKRTKEDLDILEEARDVLARYVWSHLAYDELFIINTLTGKVEISSEGGSIELDKSKYPYFTEPLRTGELFIQDIYYSKTLNMPSMSFSIPIYSLKQDRRITGILVARIDLNNSLYDLLLKRTGMGSTGETLIINHDFYALNELRWYENAPLKLQITGKSAIMASQGGVGINETTDYRNEEVLAAYTYIPKTRWGFVSKQDLKEVYAPIRKMLTSLLILLFISSSVVYMLANFLGKTISRPILEMTNVSKKIQGGDLLARNSVLSPDELGYLAESINKMAESIDKQITIQEAGTEINSTMVEATDLKAFAKRLLEKIVESTNSQLGVFYFCEKDENSFDPISSIGANPETLMSFDASNLEGEFGKALSTKKISHVKDIPDDTVFKFKTFAGMVVPKEIVTIPILIKKRVMAIISIACIRNYSDQSLEVLNRVWLGLNTSFSNLMANEETRRLAGELSSKNQELEGQANELHSLNRELKRQSYELQERNIELKVQRMEVEEANRLKSEFLSNMSHELRTPLNSIMALSRVLIMQAKERLLDEEGTYLEIIERNGKRLLSLINEILDLSKIEAGRMDVIPKRFSIRSTIEMIVESLTPIAEEKNIRILQNVPDDLPEIETDESRVHQILQNIIGNAVKFTTKGSVTVSATIDEEKMSVAILDTGIGISKQELPNIFDEFRQADGTTSRSFEGTGLGLAIAHKTTRLLGGGISVESTLGQGTIFTVEFPIKWKGVAEGYIPIGDRVLSEIHSDKQKTILAVDDEPEIPKSEGGHGILLVEDNESAIIQVRTVLEGEGYSVDVARGGGEALGYLKHKLPAGIILDLMMSGVDGFEVLDNIRSTDTTGNIPVLILTAKELTREDLKKLRSNNIQQLVQEGDVDKEGLLLKIRIMLGEEPQPDIQKYVPVKMKKSNGMPAALVVEDNPDNRITIRAVLKDKFEILEAVDGEEGLNMAVSEEPDIILLDMSLPKMDGFAVVRQLKENERTRQIPVVAITAHAMKGDRENIIKAGCDNYISKPIDPEGLLKVIENIL